MSINFLVVAIIGIVVMVAATIMMYLGKGGTENTFTKSGWMSTCDDACTRAVSLGDPCEYAKVDLDGDGYCGDCFFVKGECRISATEVISASNYDGYVCSGCSSWESSADDVGVDNSKSS